MHGYNFSNLKGKKVPEKKNDKERKKRLTPGTLG